MSEFATQALVFESEKKHSVRYNPADPSAEVVPLTAAYISKSALPRPYPRAIVITLSTLPTKEE